MGNRVQDGNTGPEMSLGNAATEKSHFRLRPRGVGLCFSLLAVQTAGVAILLANCIPLYRLMALDFANYRPDLRPWWAIAGMVVIQVAYWLRVRLDPPLPRRGNIVLGPIVLFAARMIFVSVTAGFTVMFLNRFDALRNMNYSPLRALVVLMMFFSIFCWTLELERLGKALQERQA